MYNDIDVNKIYDNSETKYILDNIKDEDIIEIENIYNFKLPKSYIEFLKLQNGGYINNRDLWISSIYGIGNGYNNLKSMCENWFDEWEYPKIGIPFADTLSGGHDLYFLDYRLNNSEPRIIRYDQELDQEYFIADNFKDFIYMIYNNKDIMGSVIKNENIIKKEERKNTDNNKTNNYDTLKTNAIMVLCIFVLFLIFAIPLGLIATLIDTSIILLCIVLIIYANKHIKKK